MTHSVRTEGPSGCRHPCLLSRLRQETMIWNAVPSQSMVLLFSGAREVAMNSNNDGVSRTRTGKTRRMTWNAVPCKRITGTECMKQPLAEGSSESCSGRFATEPRFPSCPKFCPPGFVAGRLYLKYGIRERKRPRIREPPLKFHKAAEPLAKNALKDVRPHPVRAARRSAAEWGRFLFPGIPRPAPGPVRRKIPVRGPLQNRPARRRG